MEEKLFYTSKETASMLRICESIFWRQIKKGTIPHTRIGVRVLVPASYFKELEKQAFSGQEV